MSKIYNYILLTIAIIIFFNIDEAALAATTWPATQDLPTVLSEDENAKMYYYTTKCAFTANTLSGGTMFQKEQAIIIPNGVTSADTLFIHFHGQDFVNDSKYSAGGKQDGKPTSPDNLKLLWDKYDWSTRAQEIKGMYGGKVIIYLPRLYQPNPKPSLGSGEFECFLAEAREKIKSIISFSTETTRIFSGHSAGGYTIQQVMSKGNTANYALFFDACYGSWCSQAVRTGKAASYYLYSRPGGEEEAGSKQAKDSKPDLVKMITAPISHGAIFTTCLKDHITKDLCKGKGTLVGDDIVGGTGGVPITSITVDTGIPTINEVELMLNKPTPKIEIPGLQFSDVTKTEDELGTWLHIPFFGEYLSAVYKFSVVAISVLAIIGLIDGGITRVLRGGSQEGREASTKRIIGSLTGLIIAVGSYTILYTVNPELVQFKNLKVRYVEQILSIEGGLINTDNSLLSAQQIIAMSNMAPGSFKELPALKPATQYACTPEGIREVALAYASVTPCMGPSTCTYAVSFILKRAGCNLSKLEGGSRRIGPLLMDEPISNGQKWVGKKFAQEISEHEARQTFTLDQLRLMPPGVLFRTSGHSALHLGDGVVVESTYADKMPKIWWPDSIYSRAVILAKQFGGSLTIVNKNYPIIKKVDDQLILEGNPFCPLTEANAEGSGKCTTCDDFFPEAWSPDVGKTSGLYNHIFFVNPSEKRIASFSRIYYDPTWVDLIPDQNFKQKFLALPPAPYDPAPQR